MEAAVKRRQKEALAAAAGVCTGTCQAAEQLRQELAQAKQRTEDHFAETSKMVPEANVREAQAARIRAQDAEIRALREQIEQERMFRRGLVP